MRNAYRYLALAIPVLVVVQAMTIAFEVFGLGAYVHDHALPKGAFDDSSSRPSYFGDLGGAIHAIDGEILIPLVAIALLVVSFLVKVPSGTKLASWLLLDVIVQIVLAFVSFSAPIVGLLHGVNAFVLFGLGLMAAGKASRAAESSTAAAG